MNKFDTEQKRIEKLNLLNLIEHEGDCHKISGLFCTACPVQSVYVCTSTDSDLIILNRHKYVYEISIDKYVEKYGKDADLLGILI